MKAVYWGLLVCNFIFAIIGLFEFVLYHDLVDLWFVPLHVLAVFACRSALRRVARKRAVEEIMKTVEGVIK